MNYSTCNCTDSHIALFDSLIEITHAKAVLKLTLCGQHCRQVFSSFSCRQCLHVQKECIQTRSEKENRDQY